MAISPWRLKELGIIGMNDRNINLIAEYNPRRLYPLVDNKLKTKLLAAEKGVATPNLIAAFRSQHDLKHLADVVGRHRGFAMKPAKGSGGKGILVIAEQHEDQVERDGLQRGRIAAVHAEPGEDASPQGAAESPRR